MTFRIRAFECFSGSFVVMVFLSESMFIHSILFASPLRMAVSLSSDRKVQRFFGAAEIKESISCSVGTNDTIA